ncbi:MAG: hypothetical protein ACUVS7_01835 [Bryobacteraceae bacterium]
MRKLFVCAAIACLPALFGQRLQWRQTVVEKIRDSAADLADGDVLNRTLYSSVRPDELGLEQCAQMVEAAARRVARVEEKLESLRPLVEEGVFARNELKLLEEELAERRRTLELARSRAEFIGQLAEMAQLEAALAQSPDEEATRPVQERFDGRGFFALSQLKRIAEAFEAQFGRVLPVSAHGDTTFHRRLGLDHRGRVDVAVAPDSPEGMWLREWLEREQIPYSAFRGPVAGRSSAAHIHIGPPSPRLRMAD